MTSESQEPSEAQTRLENELALLHEMYPLHIMFNSKSRAFKYMSPHSSNATLILRLPEQYPAEGEPEVISAHDRWKKDVRNKTRDAYYAIIFGEGCGEILDSCIDCFEKVTEDTVDANPVEILDGQMNQTEYKSIGQYCRIALPPKTVIIWLHHIFATWKRKRAITPSSNSTLVTDHEQVLAVDISGIAKPGCPGILIFSGRSDLVDAHVRELKELNWQAFQIRYDSSEEGGRGDQEEWEFSCCRGKIVEFQTMAEVVQNIVQEENKQIFLKAVGVK